MPYFVVAEIEKPRAGTIRTNAKTMRAALEKARGLRKYGLKVQITDLDGHPIDQSDQLNKVKAE